MEPEKAHRTLNTGLLVIIMSQVMLYSGNFGSGVGAMLTEVTVRGAIVLLMVLGLWILFSHIDEVRDYLEVV